MIESISFGSDELDFLVTNTGDRQAQERFWNQFRDADTLGSLIHPDASAEKGAADILSTLADDLLHSQTLERAHQVVRQAHALSQKYAGVVANPPYMGSKQMGARLRAFVEAEFSNAKNDLSTAFMHAGTRLRQEGGLVAMVCPQSWMFLSRYEAFRRDVTQTSPPVSLAHLGAHAFPELAGEVVQVAAVVLGCVRRDGKPTVGTFVRLVDLPNSVSKDREFRKVVQGASAERRFDRSVAHVGAIPGAPMAYWASEEILDAFAQGTPLADIAPTRKGMVTARNDEFLRLWSEVSLKHSSLGRAISREAARESGKRWFGYIKGGPARRWYGNYTYVVDWKDERT